MTTGLRISGPESLWEAYRTGSWNHPTPGVCEEYVQTNQMILPRDDAFDFLRFCGRNPKPCPLIETTDPGDPEPKLTTPEADLRTYPPRYRVYRDGEPGHMFVTRMTNRELLVL